MTSPVRLQPDDGVVMTIPQLAHNTITTTDYLVTWSQLTQYAHTALSNDIITDIDAAMDGLGRHTRPYSILPSDTAELLIYVYRVLSGNTSCYDPLQSLLRDHTVTMPRDVTNIIASNCDIDTKLLIQHSAKMTLPYWLCIIPVYPVLACELVQREYEQWSNDVRQYVLNLMLKYYTPRYHKRQDYYRALPGDWQLAIKHAAMHYDNVQFIHEMSRDDKGSFYVIDHDDDIPHNYKDELYFDDCVSSWFKVPQNTISDDISLQHCQVIASLPQQPDYMRPYTTFPAWLYDMIDHGPTVHPEFLSHDDLKLVILAADIYSWDVTTIPCLQEHLESFTASEEYQRFADICRQYQHGDIAMMQPHLMARLCGGYWIPRTPYMSVSVDNMLRAPPGTIHNTYSISGVNQVPSVSEVVKAVQYQFPGYIAPM